MYKNCKGAKALEKRINRNKWLTVLLISAIAGSIIYFYPMEFPQYANAEVNIVSKTREYKYNERVPVEVVREEIVIQAGLFEVNAVCMDRIVYCESKYNNLADNPKSTAYGVAQYLIGTWEETISYKQYHISRSDYKASLREMAIDLANGEMWRWKESYNCFKDACN